MFRKFVLAGLMATTLVGGITPAMAQRGDGRPERGNGQAGERRSENRGPSRQSMPQQQQQQSRPAPHMRAAPAQSQPRAENPWRNRQANAGQQQQQQQQNWRQQRGNEGRPDNRPDARPDARADWRSQRPTNGAAPAVRPNPQAPRADSRLDRSDWRSAQRGNQRDDRRNDQRWGQRDDNRGNNGWRQPAQNRAAPGWNNNGRRYDDRTRWSTQRRWDNGWRNDRRYDWRSYRDNYGDRYRVGRYYAPRGWNYGYQRFSVGIFLSSMLYANNYWLDDPYSYRLPPAYGSMRWVRYYDDALLVDIRDGYVVDVIEDFFW